MPNFNHAKYLRERLDAIYRQDYPNFEVILLDDASSDDSVGVLREYADRHAANTSLHVNAKNSGGVFHQWKKGLALARGDLIWIAESDDYCDPTHLSELVRFFRNEAVMLAFCRSEFVRGDEGKTEWSTDEALADCLGAVVRQPFVQSAHRLVNHGWGKKNLVVNASSAVFRHPGALPLLDDEAWTRLRLCGDWIFYLHLIRGGLVGYTPNTTNYYRQHGEGT
ncbi:MAG: glycosyltransferase family A protein, partial [Pseudomonadota bacterium]